MCFDLLWNTGFSESFTQLWLSQWITVESISWPNKSARSLRSHTASWTATHNAMYFASAVLEATKVYHGRPQSKTTTGCALPVHNAPCPMCIDISLQSNVYTCGIFQAIINCASQISQQMLRWYPVCLSQLIHKLVEYSHCIAYIRFGVD
jgi:hypothetical protein